MTSRTFTFTVPVPVLPASRKYVGGHMLTMLRGVDTQANLQSHIIPGITKAVMKRYTWRSLESTQGVYTMSEITSDLAWAQSQNVRLIVWIEDKTFGNAQNQPIDNPGPDYMIPYKVDSSTSGDQFLARWSPFFVTNFNALLTKIGQLFKDHPYFYGVATLETAMGTPTADELGIGPSGTVPAGKLYPPYSLTLYRDRSIGVIQHAATALPTTHFYWHSNYIRGDNTNGLSVTIGQIIEAVKGLGNFILGGPDVLPGGSNGANALENRFYPFYDIYADQIPLLIQIQTDSYWASTTGDFHGPAPYYTMTQIYNYATRAKTASVVGLNANFIVATYVGAAHDASASDYTDWVAVMNAHPTFNVELPP